jgi:hypothetical protein
VLDIEHTHREHVGLVRGPAQRKYVPPRACQLHHDCVSESTTASGDYSDARHEGTLPTLIEAAE